jgi:hypothetical protein
MGTYNWWSPVGPFPAALGANFNTFTARQDVSPQPLPAFIGGELNVGTKFKIEADGEFSTTATPTLVLGFYIGTVAGAITTVLAESASITTPSGAASFPWRMELRGVVTALGTAGSVTVNGEYQVGATISTYSSTSPMPITLALRTVVWDTTITRAVGVCATYNASSGSNNVRTYGLHVSRMN